MRRRFVAEIKQRRNPRTGDIGQLLDRYLDQHQGGKSTVSGYREYVDKHVRPFIGKTKVGEIDADILDSLYAELRCCPNLPDATHYHADQPDPPHHAGPADDTRDAHVPHDADCGAQVVTVWRTFTQSRARPQPGRSA